MAVLLYVEGLDAARHRRAPRRLREPRLADPHAAAPPPLRAALAASCRCSRPSADASRGDHSSAPKRSVGRSRSRIPGRGRTPEREWISASTSPPRVWSPSRFARSSWRTTSPTPLRRASSPTKRPSTASAKCCWRTPRAERAWGRSTRAWHWASAYTNMTPGTIQETGEPLDFAIEGSGFFAVQDTPQGVRYTRDGQFTTSAAGVLTDANGDPVLGAEGRADQGRLGRHRAGGRGRRVRSARRGQAGRKPLHGQRPPARPPAPCARARSRARASTPRR